MYALQCVCIRARSGVRLGVQKGVMEDLTRLGHSVQACGQLPEGDERKNFSTYADSPLALTLTDRVTRCGLPASTVNLTPPALYTCDGAMQRLIDVSQ